LTVTGGQQPTTRTDRDPDPGIGWRHRAPLSDNVPLTRFAATFGQTLGRRSRTVVVNGKRNRMAAALINRRMNGREWLALVLLSVLWGGSFFFAGVLIKTLPPFTIVFLRVGLAAVILNALVSAVGMTMPGDRSAWAAFFGMGLLNNAIPFCLVVWGQSHIASGPAAILNATTPISTVIVAHLLTDDEKITPNRLLGVAVGFVGVVVLIGPDSLKGLGASVLAQVSVLTAGVFYALAGVYGRRFKRMGIDPILTATGQVTASALMLFPIAMLIDQPWTLPVPALPAWAAIIGSATLSTALGYVLYFRILSTAGATNLLLVTLLIPVSAIIMGAVGLGERLDVRQFAGLVLIGTGLAAIDGRCLPRLREQKTVAPRS
jgi:drug/metabolite transporter (DMT)-like permease